MSFLKEFSNNNSTCMYLLSLASRFIACTYPGPVRCMYLCSSISIGYMMGAGGLIT